LLPFSQEVRNILINKGKQEGAAGGFRIKKRTEIAKKVKSD
jgi:hypothetical protein